MKHRPVLREEVSRLLIQGGPGSYFDGTLGAGGHSAHLLESLPEARVIGVDRDPEALELARERLSIFAERVLFLSGNFADELSRARERVPEGLRGVLLDLGVSSMQIDQAGRGFSYMQDGPLDMRMDPSLPESAADLIARMDQESLRALLKEYGEVRRAGRVARGILEARDRGELTGSAGLRFAVKKAVGERDSIAELARASQALRIVVNGELDALERALAALPDALAEGGVVVILSYHSLEDRPVKQFFARESRDCLCPPELPVCNCGHKRSFERITSGAQRPDAEECKSNPRARSARLRAARRIAV
jgi:16S rRNA (cytosine1402-N4)-methyltransferase